VYERHENEQYFFDEATLEALASFVSGFAAPCCVCAPMLGQRLAERGRSVRILDIDTRFSGVRGFQFFDLLRPEWLGEEFDLVLCDPPFYNVSLSRLFAAVRVVCRNDFTQPVMISYLVRRSAAILGTFAPFALAASGFRPTYQTVENVRRNDIEFFTNLEDGRLAALRGAVQQGAEPDERGMSR